MANLLHLQLSSPSSSSSSSRLAASVRRRYCSLSRDSFECRASRGGRFRFRGEDELFRDGGFEFGYIKKKKKPWWWLDDDDDDDGLMEDENDWSLVFEVFRTLSWMLAPIGLSLLLGTDSDAGLMALAVPLVQSLLSLVFSKVMSRPGFRPLERSRRGTVSRTRKARREENVGGGVGGVDKGGYKSWMVGDVGDNSTGSMYGGWDDLEKGHEIRSDKNVRPKEQFRRRNASLRWRVKEKPLLLRMLIAAFPFLSSWTKLLF